MVGGLLFFFFFLYFLVAHGRICTHVNCLKNFSSYIKEKQKGRSIPPTITIHLRPDYDSKPNSSSLFPSGWWWCKCYFHVSPHKSDLALPLLFHVLITRKNPSNTSLIIHSIYTSHHPLCFSSRKLTNIPPPPPPPPSFPFLFLQWLSYWYLFQSQPSALLTSSTNASDSSSLLAHTPGPSSETSTKSSR